MKDYIKFNMVDIDRRIISKIPDYTEWELFKGRLFLAVIIDCFLLIIYKLILQPELFR
jgi:hypothetical protein